MRVLAAIQKTILIVIKSAGASVAPLMPSIAATMTTSSSAATAIANTAFILTPLLAHGGGEISSRSCRLPSLFKQRDEAPRLGCDGGTVKGQTVIQLPDLTQ